MIDGVSSLRAPILVGITQLTEYLNRTKNVKEDHALCLNGGIYFLRYWCSWYSRLLSQTVYNNKFLPFLAFGLRSNYITVSNTFRWQTVDLTLPLKPCESILICETSNLFYIFLHVSFCLFFKLKNLVSLIDLLLDN